MESLSRQALFFVPHDTKSGWTVLVTNPFSPAVARYLTFLMVSMRCYAQHFDTTFPEHTAISLMLKKWSSTSMLIP